MAVHLRLGILQSLQCLQTLLELLILRGGGNAVQSGLVAIVAGQTALGSGLEGRVLRMQGVGVIGGLHSCHLGGEPLGLQLAGGHLIPQRCTLSGVCAGLVAGLDGVERVVLGLEGAVKCVDAAAGVVVEIGELLALGLEGVDVRLDLVLGAVQRRRQVFDGHIVRLELVELSLKRIGVSGGVASGLPVFHQIRVDLLLQLLELLGGGRIVRGVLQKGIQILLQGLLLGVSFGLELLLVDLIRAVRQDIHGGVDHVALGGLGLLEIVDLILHQGVEAGELALLVRLHNGVGVRCFSELAILILGEVDLLAVLVHVPNLERSGIGRDGVAVFIGLHQLEVVVYPLKLDGVVPAPLGNLPVVAGQFAVNVDSHGESLTNGVLHAQAVLQQLVEVVVGLIPSSLVGHVLLQHDAVVQPQLF